MSWHYLRGQAAESWEASCLDGAPSALSSLIPTPEACSLHASGTASCPPSPSGMTSEPSTASPGAGTWTSSAAASPVRTSAPPGSGLESPGSAAVSGLSTLGSLARYDPASRSWKTPQRSLFEGLEPCSVIWPRWGLMHAGECWALDTLGRLINAIGSGSWLTLPTPVASDCRQNVDDRAATRSKGGRLSQSRSRSRLHQWEMLPTPTAFDATGNVLDRLQRGGTSQGSLRQQGERLKRWETPSKADAHPRAYNRTGPYTGPHPQKHLQAQAFEQLTPHDSPSGKLNPTWVEWLMGWPMQWTDLQPLATDRFQQWLQSHGRCWPDAHGIQAEEPPAPAEGR